MTRADRVHSTPRTDSSLKQPMFPPVADAPDSIIHQRPPPADRPDETPPGGAPIQFKSLAEAEAWLQSQGFQLVPGTCNWTNDAGDDAGCYSIDGEVKGWRVEISRPKPAKGLSRRLMLAGLAVFPAALPVVAPAVVALPEDPIYSIIERHKRLSATYSVAVHRPGVGDDEPEFADVNKVCDEACDLLLDHADKLFAFQPVTTAGVVALFHYFNTIEEWEKPRHFRVDQKQFNEFCGNVARALSGEVRS